MAHPLRTAAWARAACCGSPGSHAVSEVDTSPSGSAAAAPGHASGTSSHKPFCTPCAGLPASRTGCSGGEPARAPSDPHAGPTVPTSASNPAGDFGKGRFSEALAGGSRCEGGALASPLCSEMSGDPPAVPGTVSPTVAATLAASAASVGAGGDPGALLSAAASTGGRLAAATDSRAAAAGGGGSPGGSGDWGIPDERREPHCAGAEDVLDRPENALFSPPAVGAAADPDDNPCSDGSGGAPDGGIPDDERREPH